MRRVLPGMRQTAAVQDSSPVSCIACNIYHQRRTRRPRLSIAQPVCAGRKQPRRQASACCTQPTLSVAIVVPLSKRRSERIDVDEQLTCRLITDMLGGRG